MKLAITDIGHQDWIEPRFAFGVADSANHIRLSDNRNPGLSWRDLPEGTRSLVLLCVDPVVPGKPDDVNKEGRLVPADLPRVDFYHWVMVDIPTTCEGIAEGECSDGITPRGKQDPPGPAGSRQGLNDYTGWFAGDPDMAGSYFGYDGPCPPWNDERLHHYVFTVYALDVERLGVEGTFTGPEALAAMDGHILAKASLTGTYHIYPDAKRA